MRTIGIIGAGALGTAFARALARVGLGAALSNSRGRASLTSVVDALGPSVTAVNREEAAQRDIVLVAVPWLQTRAALRDLPAWNGRIVIDANNPIDGHPLTSVELGGRLSSDVLTDLVPGARVVKAFNHLPPPLLSADPARDGGRRVLFFAGNDASANAQVGHLIDRPGFFGIDLGPLSLGGALLQFPGGPLPALHLVRFG